MNQLIVSDLPVNGSIVDAVFRTPAEMEQQAHVALLAGDYEESERLCRILLKHSVSVKAQLALAVAIRKQGRVADALMACPKDTADGCLFAASIFEDINDHERSLRAINRGLALSPEHHELNFGAGCLALRRGDYTAGWAGHEHRPTHQQLRARLDEIPEWDGKPVTHGKLLICWEMGLGDQIMFSRWIREAIDRAMYAEAVILTRPQLARLFVISARAQVVTDDRQVEASEIGAWIGIGSLAHVLGGPIPPPINFAYPGSPVIRNDFPYRVIGSGLRVGLCWQGSPEHQRDKYRSIPLEALRSLLDTPGCSFYNLQKDGKEHGLTDPMPWCHDLADTAAVIRQLDLVITADTAMLHLAGSLGVPTWGLLGAPSDWRWGVEGETTAWYPSVRLFRCKEPLEWGPVIDSVCAGLNAEITFNRHVDEIKTAKIPQQAPNTAMVTTRYGPMLISLRDRWPGRSLKVYGEWSEGEVHLFREFIKPGDVVIEAGANVGAHTLPLAKILGPEGTLYAIEPNPDTFRLLSQNCEQVRNDATVHMLMYAVSASIGECAIACQDGNLCNGHVVEGSGVQMITVDSLNLPRLDFLKADIEGHELEMLKGAESTIARCRPLLYVEDDRFEKNEALLTWLHAHDYKLYQHYPRLFNPDNFNGYKVNVFGNIVSAMLLCVPREKFFDLRIVEKFGLERVTFE